MTETSTVLIVFNSVLAYTITISSRIRNQKADILDSDCQCNLTAQIELVQDKLIYFVLSDKNLHGSVLLQVITITGADPGRGTLKLEKNMIFLCKFVIFHTKYLQNFQASLRSPQLF